VNRRRLLLIAVLGNALVATAAFAVYGWNADGAHSAARSTARFSALWFMVGFAAPGLARWVRDLPAPAHLIQSFVAAHMVHFATVIVVLAFTPAHVSGNPIQAAAVVLVGFSVVLGAGLTAIPRPSRLYTAVHRATVYVIFLIFFLDSFVNPIKPLRVYGVFLVLALVLRHAGRFATSEPQVKTAGPSAA
jgi:hypothetical protein